MQGALFPPASGWRPPRVSDLPSWDGAARVSIDTETRDPDLEALGPGVRRPGSYIVGVSFAIEDGPKHYLPLRHEGGDNVDDPTQAILYLRDNAAAYRKTVVGANLGYDLDFLAEEGIVFPGVEWFRDVLLCDPLIYELHNSYSLDNVAKRRGFEGKDEALLTEAAAAHSWSGRKAIKKNLWRLPARYVGPYAEGDAEQPLLVSRAQEREVEADDLWGVYNLECKLLPVLVKVRRRGVRVDLDKLAQIEQWTVARERKLLEEVFRLTGVRIKLGDSTNSGAVAPALQFIGVDVPLTPKTKKPSVDKFLLAGIDHPVARSLEMARKVNKLRTTFAASVRNHMTNGRIHCTLNQTVRDADEDSDSDDPDQVGAAYGRLSCEHPNMQQQPSRDEFAKDWRSIYLAERGDLWASCDYSQQEPRWTTHFAEELNLPRAREAAERYRNDPTTDNHQMMSDMTGAPRKAAKEIYLGLCYGMGGPKLCGKLKLPTRYMVRLGRQVAVADSAEGQALSEMGGRRYLAAGEEAQALLDKFDQGAPFIKKLAKRCEDRAKAKGYIRTISGRRCHFPKDEAGNYDWTHKALNRLIQGSSGDQTKESMVALDREGFDIILQVHDEVPMSVGTEEEAHQGAAIMRDIVPCRVPMRVDVEVGTSWGGSMG